MKSIWNSNVLQFQISKKLLLRNGQNWPELFYRKSKWFNYISKNWALTYNIWIKIVTMIPLINNEDYKILTDVNKNTTENKLISIINSLSPHAFELFIVDMLRNSKKYKRVSQSQRTRDGGVDFRAYYVDDSGEKIRLIGEVKKWNKPVPESVIDRLSAAISRERDLLRAGEISRGVIVATKGLSPVAMETARKNEIEIWDLNTITRMVNEAIRNEKICN